MKSLNGLSELPVYKSLVSLKKGDLKSSYKILGITDKEIQEREFINCMMKFEQGINLLRSGNHSKSVEPLSKAMSLIKITNDEEAKFIVSTLINFAKGITKLLKGDTHEAAKLLKLSSDSIQRLNFFLPGLEKTLLSFKAASEAAIARTYINIGDLDAVESIFGEVIQIHDELLSKLDEKNDKDFPFFNEVFGTRIEFSLLFMRIDLEALDFDSLNRRIEFTKENLNKLEKFIDKVPDSPIKTATEIIQILFHVFESYSRIGKNIIQERLPLKESEIKELLTADKNIFEAQQKANKAGDRGKMFLYTINQLKRLNDNYFVIGKVEKRDFGRMSGIIALTALVLQLFIIHLTIKPSGNIALLFFFGEIIVSLIAGYGYEAIKFKPLLNLYTYTIKNKS